MMKRSKDSSQRQSQNMEECGPMDAAAVRFCQVSKKFGDQPVLRDVSFSIDSGSRVVLYGPSGSGKSTILRLIAGLIQADAGYVKVQENLKVSLVFQSDRLFPQISCLDNILYGLYATTLPKKEMIRKAEYWAEVFCCREYLSQKTGTLSGGQRQRAALARAFMKDPDLLLLDESFSSMDAALKDELMHRLLELQKEKKFTIVFVTHNYDEARIMGETMLVLKKGRLVQYGSVWDAVLKPADLFEAKAFGGYTWNLIPVSALQEQWEWASMWAKESIQENASIENERWTNLPQENGSMENNVQEPAGQKSLSIQRGGKESQEHQNVVDQRMDKVSFLIPEHAGWIGISAYNCSCSAKPGWLKLEAKELDVRNIGYCWLHLLLLDETRICAASSQKEYNGSFWMNPKEILFFDQEGLLIGDRVPGVVESA